MNIKNYTSFFHDGSILSINQFNNNVTIIMESAEMDTEDLKDDVILSKNDRIRGKLHIEGIKSIRENDQIYLDKLRMKDQDAGIFHFEINKNRVNFQIIWNSYPPKPLIEDFSTIEIEAEKIWWENIPDLEIST